MAQNNNYLGADNFCSALHTSQNVLIQNITCNSNAKDVTETLIEDQLSGSPAINTAQYGSKWELSFGSVIYLLKEISIRLQILDESVVTFFEDFNCKVWR